MRDLEWQGCLNVRDLGGLGTVDGRVTAWRAVVRSDNPSFLTPVGWSALHRHGVRTIVTLRTIGAVDEEPDPALVPGDVTVERVLLEDATDPAFVERSIDTGRWETPLHFIDMLERWPERCAGAVAAVARAGPGGVLISCGRGRDRTGLVALLLLGLVGVPADVVATDWVRSVDRLRSRHPADEEELSGVLERQGSSVHAAIAASLALDVPARLRAGGLGDDDARAIRRRLLARTLISSPEIRVSPDGHKA